jgi:anti-sigma28 factor (negative regulator of flagellin synthesis)
MKIRKQDTGLIGELGRRSDQITKDQNSTNTSRPIAGSENSDLKINISTGKAIRDIIGANSQDKIARIKNAIENGSYKVSTDKIADSLVQHIKEEVFYAKAEGGESFSSDDNDSDNSKKKDENN